MQVGGTVLDPQNSHSKAKRSVSQTCIVQLYVCKACLMKVCASHTSTGQACAGQECVRFLLPSSKGWVGCIQSSLWKYFNPESMPMPILHTSVYVPMGNIFYPWKQNTCFFFLTPDTSHVQGEFIQFMLAEWIRCRLLFFSYEHGSGQGWLKEFLIKHISSPWLHECYPCRFIYSQWLLLRSLKISVLGICPRTQHDSHTIWDETWVLWNRVLF